MELFTRYLPWFLVLLFVQYGLQIWATIDLVYHDNIHGKKWVWVLVILLGETLGPIIYLLFGKKKS
jgi:hypothetical protein